MDFAMLRPLQRFRPRTMCNTRACIALFVCLNIVVCTYTLLQILSKRYGSGGWGSLGSNSMGLPLDVPKYQSGIPQAFHQAWKDVNVPVAFSSIMDTWGKNQPNWRKYFWEWESVDRLVAAMHPEFLETFRSLPYQEMRLDIFKYMLMYYIGGIYADIDMQSLRSMGDLLDAHACILPTNQHIAIVHGQQFTSSVILMCRPGHPFYKKVLDYFTHLDPGKLRSTEDTGAKKFGELAAEYMTEAGLKPVTGPQDALTFAESDHFLPRAVIPREKLLETCMDKLTGENIPDWMRSACKSLKTRDFNSFLPLTAYTDHHSLGIFEEGENRKYDPNLTIHIQNIYGKYYVLY